MSLISEIGTYSLYYRDMPRSDMISAKCIGVGQYLKPLNRHSHYRLCSFSERIKSLTAARWVIK